MTSLSTVQSTSATTTRSSLHSLRRLALTPVPTPQNLRLPNRHTTTTSFKIRAIDAAQPYDYEARISHRFAQSTKLKIAIVGFGNFGQFLAKAFIRQGHAVLAHSRTDYSAVARSMGASFFADPHDLCEQHPDVILLCTSIISTEQVLKSLPILRLKRNTLFVDVLSVKEFPKQLFLQILPRHFDILCTHPMFGPESGKDTWHNLPFVFDKVRIGNDDGGSRMMRADTFLDIFNKEGCRMVEMTCAEHDRYAAGSQFITHTMGRVLEKLGLQPTPINTKGYETLLDLVDNTKSDSFDLYYGLFMYNDKAMEELARLDEAFECLKMELFGHLHKINRKQLFGELRGWERPVITKLKRDVPPALPSPPSNNGTALPAPQSSNGASNGASNGSSNGANIGASNGASNGAALPAPPSPPSPSESVRSPTNLKD